MSEANCPSMEQTAAGLGTTKSLAGNLSITNEERIILQGLARKVAELAVRPVEEEKKVLWTAHNDLEPCRPMVNIDPENGWNEIITQDQIKCKHPLFRVWEMQLRKEIFWAEGLKDDRVIEPYFNVPYNYEDTGWGLAEVNHGDRDHGGSIVWDSPIKNYEEDLPKLQYPEIKVDYKATNQVLHLAEEIFDGILEVRLRGIWWWTLGLTWEFIKMRGLTNLMMDMYDHPEGVHGLMSFLKDGTLKKLDFLEKEGLLALNTEGAYVGSGGFGWTKQLPGADYNPVHVKTMNMWGFCESQETVGVSPDMFAEFILPYQKEIMARFAINCYGCCEPINTRWDYVKTLPRLRRISSSPWADRAELAELLGKNYIQSIKPNPSFLAQSVMDEEAARKELRDSLEVSKGTPVELIMKDNHTLGKNPQNAVRWVEMAREEIDRLG